MSNRLFNQVPVKKRKYNKFNLSFINNLSCNFGELIPVLCQEIVPGDKFRIKTETFVRLAPMVAPAFTSIDAYIHYFFVPNRLVYNGWEEFITVTDDNFVHPFVNLKNLPITAYGTGSLADYLGVNTNGIITADVHINVMPFRGYQLIYNEYYRDENLQDEIQISKLGGSDSSVENFRIRYRNWQKDYFTSCLPTSQLGGETILPISGDLEVLPDGRLNFENEDGSQVIGQQATYLQGSSPSTHYGHLNTYSSAQPLVYHSGLKVDLSNASSTTINELRRALKIQEWKENSIRGGHRYIESIYSHFGVLSSDARLQRPQYIGGGKCPVVVSEIAQTSATEQSVSPQGNLVGKGTAVGNMNYCYFNSEEHGFIFAILSIMPKASYMNGLHRMWTRFDPFDYLWPEFSNLGEQEVLNQELFLSNTSNITPSDHATNLGLFGYQSRYAEYKTNYNQIHGDFKNSMSFWHNGRIFSNTPALNTNFISFGGVGNPTSQNRIFAVQDPDSHHFYCSFYHNISALRKLPKFGVPSI